MHMKKELGDTKDVLQDIVVVVSLVSTLAKSFGSAGELYRKLKKKTKNTKKGLKEDIKHEIEEHLPGHEHSDRRDSHSDDRHHHRWQSRSRSRHARDESCDSGKGTIERSHQLVQSEFDRGYHLIGEKFAIGDLITRNQLQAQIIILQQRLLYTYEDVMMDSEHPRHPSSYHLKELVHTTRTARLAVIEALAQQYQRMLPVLEHKEPLHLLPGSFPTSPKLRPSHDIIVHEHKTERVEEHHSSLRSPHHSGNTPSADLFCFYARNLQRTSSLPLADTFKTGGNDVHRYLTAPDIRSATREIDLRVPSAPVFSFVSEQTTSPRFSP
ncbi:hypothetical protein GRF29_1g2764697 [Pseudopithomyces chartarum]|uniref:Uncharacterized protein n=1 Tax=Pseudopithomyces chartarum TaxID=1892770 RepID=A0AAN6M8V7_9PLEO|nr:hypothetical protein GRF29_1g2764697 [Pseudopithomyces chartarum]